MTKPNENFDEALAVKRAERTAEQYLRKYRPQFEDLELSPLAKLRGLSVFDYANLGEQLYQFEQYKDFITEAGTAVDLGKLPTVAFDIITAVYGSSILPFLASIQPIEEERGIVYYKKTVALNTKGNVTAGDTLRRPNAMPDVHAVGYAGEKIDPDVRPATSAGVLAYSGTLAKFPVRPNTIKFVVGTLNFKAQDDGEGNLLGNGFFGTVNYLTGAYSLVFAADPGAGRTVTASYGVDYEAGAAIPKINVVNTTESVEAEIFVLGQEMGMFKAFSMQKRFGRIADDEMVNDLTNEITAELGNTAIARLTSAAVGTTTWDATRLTGVAWSDQKKDLLDYIHQSEAVILGNTGRGVINYIIASPLGASVLGSMEGFVKNTMNAATGPQIYGTLNGITIIRAPQLAGRVLYPVFRGSGNFDAPLVYSPYMPLFVTGSLPVPNNPLVKQGIAAVWAGLKVLVPAFATRIDITNYQNPPA